MSTNKDQKTWLKGAKAAGSIWRIGAADFVADGMLQSLPGAAALKALEKMSDEELAVSLSGEWGIKPDYKASDANDRATGFGAADVDEPDAPPGGTDGTPPASPGGESGSPPEKG